jgi:hypothetical protein
MKRLFLLSVILFYFCGCSYSQSSLEIATDIVKQYIESEATDPLHLKNNWSSFIHPDFVAVGGEGSLTISIIDQKVIVLSTTPEKGDINIINPGEEEYIKVVVRLKEILLIKNDQVQKTSRDRDILFFLSKRGSTNGNYQILDIKNFKAGTRLGYIQNVKKELSNSNSEIAEKKILYEKILKQITALDY